jgi:predicted nucleotidyltransferase
LTSSAATRWWELIHRK